MSCSRWSSRLSFYRKVVSASGWTRCGESCAHSFDCAACSFSCADVWSRDEKLRRTSKERKLRAFRNTDRFTTLKIFRRSGALRGLTNQLRCFRSRFGRSNRTAALNPNCAKGRDSSLTAERKIKPPASAQEAKANFKIKGGLGTYTDPDEKQTNQMPSATNAPTSKPILFGFAIAKLCSSSAPLLPAEVHAKFRR